MKRFTSRPAVAIAAMAMLSMTATPVLARDWGWGGYGRHHRHHDRVDAGDVFAGLLILGGIAAVASAASSADKAKRERDYRYPEPDPRAESGRYGDSRDPRAEEGRGDLPRGASEMGGAVDACVAEIERGDRQVESVDNVSRDPEGWRVDGRLGNGRDFSCTIDRDGRVRRATVDGHAA